MAKNLLVLSGRMQGPQADLLIKHLWTHQKERTKRHFFTARYSSSWMLSCFQYLQLATNSNVVNLFWMLWLSKLLWSWELLFFFLLLLFLDIFLPQVTDITLNGHQVTTAYCKKVLGAFLSPKESFIFPFKQFIWLYFIN